MKSQKELLPFELAAGFAAVAVIAFVVWANSLPPATPQPQPGINQQPTTPSTVKVVSKVNIESTPVIKPVITSPKNGSVDPSTGFTISGKASPNYFIWAYINIPASELGVVYANGGATQADASGNFSMVLAEPCSHNLSVVVMAVPNENAQINGSYVSEPVTFTVTGPLQGVCYQ